MSKPTSKSDEEKVGDIAQKEEQEKDDSDNGNAAAGSSEASESDSMSTTDFLREYLAHSLGLRDKPESKLEELTLAGVAKYLASDQCKNVVTMAGAGISTSAGIPDFRSPGTGLYSSLASYDLPHPTAIFEIDFFMRNPKPFFVLAKELYPGSFKPTPCHYFVKLLNDKGKLLRHYTQNIDTLERVAGLDEEKLVEAHGTFHTSHCLTCRKEYTLSWMEKTDVAKLTGSENYKSLIGSSDLGKEQIFADNVPRCTEKGCNGIVKPDIVFFGEALPRHFSECVQSDFSKCDLLIVMGTSLTVQPFATLVNRVPFTTPRLYINLEKGMSYSHPITVLHFGGGFNFDSKDNYRDVFKKATCDDGCQELADLLSWGEELRELVKTEHARIKQEKAKTECADSTEKKGKNCKCS